MGQPATCFDGAEPERRGVLGSGRSLGTVADFSACSGERSGPHQLHGGRARGFTGSGRAPKAESIGLIPFGGHETAREFREKIEAPLFRYYLHGKGEKPAWQASMFQTGSNTLAAPMQSGRPKRRSRQSFTCMRTARCRSRRRAGRPARQGISRVRLGSGEPGAVSSAADLANLSRRRLARLGRSADQRFVDHRPDVLSFVSAAARSRPDGDRALAATLFASTSGTDSDFVVKLIDVYPENAQPNAWDAEDGPEPGQYAQSLNGYQLPIAMEVRRGRYLAKLREAARARRPTSRRSGRSHCEIMITCF